jgi:hypothetical protein
VQTMRIRSCVVAQCLVWCRTDPLFSRAEIVTGMSKRESRDKLVIEESSRRA